MKKKRKEFIPEIQISLRVGKTGYYLDVDNEGYLYRNIDDLIEGFYMHVGLGRPNEMTKEQRLKMLDDIKNATVEKQLQREAADLRKKLRKEKFLTCELKMKLKKYEW